jgi:hypothetical protein
MQNLRWQILHPFSARLTHGLKLDTVVWLLRCSVLRGTSMASAKNIQFQKAKVLQIFQENNDYDFTVNSKHSEAWRNDWIALRGIFWSCRALRASGKVLREANATSATMKEQCWHNSTK